MSASTSLDFSLFPTREEWGTGDEAMDNKLSIALKKAQGELSFSSIREFYLFGLSLKPRAYNPSFSMTIDMATKALLYCLEPSEYNDHLFLKIKGNYFQKEIISFELAGKKQILDELETKRTYRYQGQIDFSLSLQSIEERNPFVRHSLKRSPYLFHVKIIFKDFKNYLSGEKESLLIEDDLFNALRLGENVLFINNFGELWYDQGQIFSLMT